MFLNHCGMHPMEWARSGMHFSKRQTNSMIMYVQHYPKDINTYRQAFCG